MLEKIFEVSEENQTEKLRNKILKSSDYKKLSVYPPLKSVFDEFYDRSVLETDDGDTLVSKKEALPYTIPAAEKLKANDYLALNALNYFEAKKDPAAYSGIIDILAGKLSVDLKFPDTVVNGSVAFIGIALFDQSIYHIDHFGNNLGGKRMLHLGADI